MNGKPDFSDDEPVLHAFGAPQAELIGHGGEARVYALDDQRVVRLLHPGADLLEVRDRAALTVEIAAGARHLPFATPEIEDILEIEGRIATVERRWPGQPLSLLLGSATGSERERLLNGYLDAVGRIREIELGRDGFGDLVTRSPVRRRDYRTYLRDRIAQTRRTAIALTEWISQDIAAPLPDCAEGRLVHFDLFPGNILFANDIVTAVIDFGPTAMIADPNLDLWSAVSYLDIEISPNATDADRAFAHNWLAHRGLDADYEAARRWIAAYWCYALDDPNIMKWCRSVLERPSIAEQYG